MRLHAATAAVVPPAANSNPILTLPASDTTECFDQGLCSQFDCGDETCVSQLMTFIGQIPDQEAFDNGEYIACVHGKNSTGGICASYQHINGTALQAGHAGDLILNLTDSGCEKCGLTPLPTSLNMSDYSFTYQLNPAFLVDFVPTPCPHGPCR
ncbi:MAG: hypothetical protein M1838_002505 [Thelocarpon superellum]|nr:MAG: hypothetical protein M1838_002505 [Thelocarpon superellum]